jgi:diguanylate cyclase (GGDEF)-like protein/PAS domain S-box-containing protein
VLFTLKLSAIEADTECIERNPKRDLMSPLAARNEMKHAGDRPPPSAARAISPTAWRWFLALEAVFALIYFPFGAPSGGTPIMGFLPWMEWPGQVPAWALLGLSAAVAIAYGIRRHRPNAPVAWWFMCGGVLLFITGDTSYKIWHQIIGRQQIPFPSFIDVIYITMYPVLAVGLLLLARARVPGGNRASLLDSLTITFAVGLLSWTFLIGPTVRAPGDMLVRLTAAAYPLGDILVLAMLAHLWSAGGLRNTAGRLLAIGAVGTLVADSIYGLANLHTGWNWQDGNPIDLGWIIFYSCWGAAALHPSMRALSEPRAAAPPRTSRARLMLLAGASLIAPAILFAESALGRPVDAGVIAVVAAIMFLLVLMRMAGLVQDHQQAVTRERVLRTAAAELVAAPGNAGIYEATINAVSALVSGRRDIAGVTLAMSAPEGGLTVVAQSGEPAEHRLLSLLALRADVRGMLNEGRVARCALEATDRVAGHGEQAAPEQVLICPLLAKEQLQGLIAVTSASEIPVDLTTTIETLAAQVGLALDREALTETFHARRSEARFQTLVQNASDIILIARPDTTITYQTPSAQRILGYEPGSLEGERLTALIHPDDVEQALALYTAVAFREGTPATAQWRVRHRQGSWCHVEVVANNLLSDPTVEGIVLTMRDVSDRKSLEEELKHQAFHDALSGLANRALFRDRLEHASERAARSRTSLAVLFLDLDDFKLVNDSLGHASGDEMLVAVGERLRRSVRAGDTAARFGGDEFAVLLEEISGLEEASQLAKRILNELHAPLRIADREIQARASIGIAFSPAGGEAPADLLQAADVAMYAAKGRGKGRYEVYNPALQVAITERLERSAELQRAVEEKQFVVYYQPIVSLAGDETVGVEALVRWQHPTRGLLLPAEFIALAEETGLIIPLGRWVLQQACQQARRWELDYPNAGRLRVSVNISARHFQHDGLVDDVSNAVSAADYDPRNLVLEITESVLVQDADAVVARMLALRRLGVTFALDDFGTGYSSLSYLKRFPIDILKVDKSFVDGVGLSPENGALAKAIVQLGHTLHLETVAEGIEQARQVESLRELGCRLGQGFYFARALPAAQIDELLSQQLSVPAPPGDAMESQEAVT